MSTQVIYPFLIPGGSLEPMGLFIDVNQLASLTTTEIVELRGHELLTSFQVELLRLELVRRRGIAVNGHLLELLQRQHVQFMTSHPAFHGQTR